MNFSDPRVIRIISECVPINGMAYGRIMRISRLVHRFASPKAQLLVLQFTSHYLHWIQQTLIACAHKHTHRHTCTLTHKHLHIIIEWITGILYKNAIRGPITDSLRLISILCGPTQVVCVWCWCDVSSIWLQMTIVWCIKCHFTNSLSLVGFQDSKESIICADGMK